MRARWVNPFVAPGSTPDEGKTFTPPIAPGSPLRALGGIQAVLTFKTPEAPQTSPYAARPPGNPPVASPPLPTGSALAANLEGIHFPLKAAAGDRGMCEKLTMAPRILRLG